MTKQMAFCNIQYTYESYVGIDVEKLAWKIHDYVLRETPISFIQLGAKGENKSNEAFENPEDDYQRCRKREQ